MTVAAPTEGLFARGARLRDGALLILAVAAALHPFAYAGSFAGDAEIHLVFGESAARGRFFEFNPGEPVSGETSPGMMLIIAAFFRLMPARAVPLAVWLLDLLAWYLLAGAVFALARRRLESWRWALAAACTSGLLPGSCYNATIGMENGIFALLAFVWLNLTYGGWCERAETGRAHREQVSARAHPAQPIGRALLAGAALAAAAWIRPEGVVVIALALPLAWWHLPADRRRTVVGGVGVVALPSLVLLFWFTGSHTGQLVPTSALSRMTIAVETSWHLGPLRIDPKFLERLAIYAPLPLFAAYGLRGDRSPVSRALATIFLVFFALYSTVLGAAHLARYAIFLMPMLSILALGGLKTFLGRPANDTLGRRRWLAVAAAGVWFAAAVGAEARYRMRGLSGKELAHAMEAPGVRGTYSDQLYEKLGRPTPLPVVLAMQEVQERYRLDERFVVRSLDGRVDPLLLTLARDGRPDFIAYLKARQVRFLLGLPTLALGDPLIARLVRLPVGGELTHEGLTFRGRALWVQEVLPAPL